SLKYSYKVAVNVIGRGREEKSLSLRGDCGPCAGLSVTQSSELQVFTSTQPQGRVRLSLQMKMERCLFFLSLSSLLLLSTANVRLADGNSPCAGRVEVYRNGQWGTVCDGGWDPVDAGVVCRQLGCEDVAVPMTKSFGPGSGEIWMGFVDCKGSESTLIDCKLGFWQYNCYHIDDTGVICSAHRSVRLVDGADLCVGRVEVDHGSSTGTVCNADFDQQDAEVMCRQLGCGVPKEWGEALFGQGGDRMWTEEIQCRGNESQIYSCPTAPSQNQSCSHRDDVGLKCSAYTESRLADGPDRCSGRVELKYLGKWGKVCDACWDSQASNVLCRQLKCGNAVAMPGQAWFGKGSLETRGDMFDCHGNETSISQCAISSWNRAVFSDTEVVGVICSDSVLAALNGTVRLAGGSECMGHVEVYYQGNWSRVVGTWSSGEALCSLQAAGLWLCGAGEEVLSRGVRGSDVCVSGIQCSGEEPHLMNCSAPHKLTCGSEEQMTINCSRHRSLRLVGGGGDCAGRLEVFHRGSWGTVCDDSWDLADAQVVCRQLQCGTALSDPVPSFFGPGKGHVWLEEVGCVGNETSLWDCPMAEWDHGYCGHKRDVGVVCSEFKEMRLTDGCSGNLEVFYNGTWGNVCDNGLNGETAALICQELNCGKSGYVDQKQPRLKSAPYWLDHFECRPHDSSLWHCPSNSWGQNECGTGASQDVAFLDCRVEEDESVQRSKLSCSSEDNRRPCTNHWPLRLVGGEGGCSGRLEVFLNGSWNMVCGDSWGMEEAQVVCRQVGCGSAVAALNDTTTGTGSSNSWLTEVKCRGSELHLWDCQYSEPQHNSCPQRNHAGATCTGYSSDTNAGIPSVTTISTQPLVATRRPADLQASLPIPTVAFMVMGALLFLLLAILGAMLLQNRALRRALSEWESSPLNEAIYEELEVQAGERGYLQPRWGDLQTEETPANYDDVITLDKPAKSMEGELVEGDAPEYYDDVIQEGPGDHVTDTENYDDAVTLDWIQMGGKGLTTENPPTFSGRDYDDVGEGLPERGGEY
ncbi:hypothetical protein GJAV_G00146200, partial [Gymnothorax javanicus]